MSEPLRQNQAQTPSQNPGQGQVPVQTSPGGCLVRLFWMLGGNIALFFTAVYIVKNKAPLFGVADIVFGAATALLIAARFVDVAYLNGCGSDGRRSTMADWRRYAATILAVAAGVFAAAHAIAHFAG